jgi:hypothetical protein
VVYLPFSLQELFSPTSTTENLFPWRLHSDYRQWSWSSVAFCAPFQGEIPISLPIKKDKGLRYRTGRLQPLFRKLKFSLTHVSDPNFQSVYLLEQLDLAHKTLN